MGDPQRVGDSYQMQLLEPMSWIGLNNAQAGNLVNLSLPELGISGPAQVTSVGACPPIEAGAGRVILGTFEHVSNDVVDVNLVGESAPLQVTAGHKLWSLDRDGWVEAGDLKPGERLAGENGPVTVQSVTADANSVEVYNLDVETDHRYEVTDLGILAHNVDPCSVVVSAADLSTIRDMSPQDFGVGVYDVSTGKVWISPSSELADGGGWHVDLYEKIFGADATQALVDGESGGNFRGFVVGKDSSGRFTMENNSSLNGPTLKMSPGYFNSLKATILSALNGS